jgi:hypothetical protein
VTLPVQFVWTILAAAVSGGIAWATMRGKIEKAQNDVNNIGGISRGNERRAERRWKHMIATQIETSASLDEAKQHAKLLREDAWRD